MDNAKIHHGDEVVELVEAFGVSLYRLHYIHF